MTPSTKYNVLDNNQYAMKQFCEEVSKQLTSYRVTSISNITCGKTYKKKNANAVMMQLNHGYYYAFTAVCCKTDS